MFETNLPFYIAVEIAAGLLFICVFLLWFLRGRFKLTQSLERKIIELRKKYKQSQHQLKEAKHEIQTLKEIEQGALYKDLLVEQINGTLAHHRSLDADQHIMLDVSADVPPQRQIAALRYSYLLTEQEAELAVANGEPRWSVLEPKLQQLLAMYNRQPATNTSDAEIKVLRRRIAELESYKSKYFEQQKQDLPVPPKPSPSSRATNLDDTFEIDISDDVSQLDLKSMNSAPLEKKTSVDTLNKKNKVDTEIKVDASKRRLGYRDLEIGLGSSNDAKPYDLSVDTVDPSPKK